MKVVCTSSGRLREDFKITLYRGGHEGLFWGVVLGPQDWPLELEQILIAILCACNLFNNPRPRILFQSAGDIQAREMIAPCTIYRQVCLIDQNLMYAADMPGCFGSWDKWMASNALNYIYYHGRHIAENGT